MITHRMAIVKIRIMLAALVLLVSGQVGAAPIDIVDNDTYLSDTVSNLDWLDVSASVNRSFIDVSSQFDVGGDFNGWRYAAGDEVVGLVYNFLGQPFPDYPDRRQNFPPGSVDGLVDMLGITNSFSTTYGIISDRRDAFNQLYGGCKNNCVTVHYQ